MRTVYFVVAIPAFGNGELVEAEGQIQLNIILKRLIVAEADVTIEDQHILSLFHWILVSNSSTTFQSA